MRLIFTLLVALFLAGCATPFDRTVTVAGKTIIEHVDYTDNPCGTRGVNGGCYREGVGGLPGEVWYSGVAPQWVIDHEVKGHAIGGMKHTDWRYDNWLKEACSKVTQASPGYPLDAIICNDGRRERVIEIPK